MKKSNYRFKYPNKNSSISMTKPEKDFFLQCRLKKLKLEYINCEENHSIAESENTKFHLLRVDFENTKFRLGDDWKRTYKPDFRVVWRDGIVSMVEVKQRDKSGKVLFEDDAWEKYKNATENFTEYQWVWASFSKFLSPNWIIKCTPNNEEESKRWQFLT